MNPIAHPGRLLRRELEALQFGDRERVTDTHLPHIAELPRVLPGLFADAAARAQEAGFDGVQPALVGRHQRVVGPVVEREVVVALEFTREALRAAREEPR